MVLANSDYGDEVLLRDRLSAHGLTYAVDIHHTKKGGYCLNGFPQHLLAEGDMNIDELVILSPGAI